MESDLPSPLRERARVRVKTLPTRLRQAHSHSIDLNGVRTTRMLETGLVNHAGH